MEVQFTKEFAKQFIENGGLCKRIRGFEFRGARPRVISKEEALALLPNYGFGMSYHEINFINKNGEFYLEFAEYSESDLY